MEKQQAKCLWQFKFFGLVVFGIFILAPLNSLEAKLSLDNDRFVVGQKFSIDIQLDAPESLKVKLNQPTYPAGLTLASGPFIREAAIDQGGKTIKGTHITLNFEVKSPGIVSLGPFSIAVADQSTLVPAKTIYLLAKDEADKRFPIETEWVVPNSIFYTGQDIPLLLQVKNLESMEKPADLDLPAPANSLWQKAVGLGEIEIATLGEDRIMNIPWGGWILIPTEPGIVILPETEINVAGRIRKTQSVSLNILPLPQEISATRAVGDFSYTVTAHKNDDGSDAKVVVVQQLSGRGNFPYLILPEISGSGLKLLARQENAGYHPTLDGYQGSLEVVWKFSVEKSGKVTVNLPGFTSFQPELNKIWTWDAKKLSLSVNAQTSGHPVQSPENFPPLTWNQVQQVRSAGLVGQPWMVLFFLPGAIFLASTFIIKRKSKKSLLIMLPLCAFFIMSQDSIPAGFNQALSEWRAGRIENSLNLWNTILKNHPQEPGLWFNKGLSEMKLGNIPMAIYSFEKAKILRFNGDQSELALNYVEQKEQLADQWQTWNGPSEDILYLLLLIFFNLVFIFWGIFRLIKKPGWIIPLTISILLTLSSLSLFIMARQENTQVQAVVGLTDAPIRRVPGDLAEEWLTLKKGTVVKFLGHSGHFALVQTGYGLEGWVPDQYFLILSHERF